MTQCTALVPLGPMPGQDPARRIIRPDAAFVTHILAHVLDMPGQRRRRREGPQAAAGRYRHMAHPGEARQRGLDRSL